MKSFTGKQVGQDRMLYDGDLDAVHILNPTAQLVYDLHREGLTVEGIAAALASRFALGPDQDPVADVRRTLQELAERGLA